MKIIGRVRHLTHVYLCTKRELYREMNAAKAHCKVVDHQLDELRERARHEKECSTVYYNNWRREQQENGRLRTEIESLRHRIAQTPRICVDQAS